MSFLATFPEIVGSLGTLHVRHDLTNKNITIGLLAFDEWHVDTVELQVNPQLIHFVEPVGNTLVGIKVFSADSSQSGGIFK